MCPCVTATPLQGVSEEDARQLYEAAAEAGLAQQRPPAPEDHLTAAMQEQEEKLRVRILCIDFAAVLCHLDPDWRSDHFCRWCSMTICSPISVHNNPVKRA